MYSTGLVSGTPSLLMISQGTPFSFPTKVISSEQCSNLQSGLVSFLQYLYESLSYKISPSLGSSSFLQILFYFFKWRLNFICFHKRITRLQAFWLITPSFTTFSEQYPQQDSERTVLQRQNFASVVSTLQYEVTPLRRKLNLHKCHVQKDILFPKNDNCTCFWMWYLTYAKLDFFFITFHSALEVSAHLKQILYSHCSSVFYSLSVIFWIIYLHLLQLSQVYLVCEIQKVLVAKIISTSYFTYEF
jgi:hypothetical protein